MYNEELAKIEKELVKKKEWIYMGEVDTKNRPTNSLLSKSEIKFDVIEQLEPISAKQNDEIIRLTLQRLREGTFDNYSYAFEEEVEINEDVGFTEGENEETLDVIQLYNEIEGELLKISDFGNLGFLPDVNIVVKKVEDPIKNKIKPKVKDLNKAKNVTVLKN